MHDAPLRFVSQCHLIGTKTFMLMIIDENYIEFLISIWRNVPIVNTKLYRFSTHIAIWVNCSPCCKLKCLIVNVLRYCTLKFWLLIDKLKVHATSGSGAGVTTFWRSLFSGESLPLGCRYFRDVLAATKFDVNFGGCYFRGIVTIGT